MAKLLEDSVGTYGNILLALTFVGVMYLVVKQAKINLQLSTGSTSDPFTNHKFALRHIVRFANTPWL